jgi:arylsulfatase A-like enzyme
MTQTPNLLFIFTDEQRYDTLGAYGNDRIRTPNLDRLAAQACAFDRAYVTQPVCTPSRSTILTGLWPHTTGCTENNVPLPQDVPCLPEMLPPGRWAAAYHGKWHLGDEIFPQHGFSQWRSIEDLYARHYSPGRDPSARSSYHHWLMSHGFRPANGDTFTRPEASRLPEPFGKPAYLAGEARRFLRAHASEPFVLYVNFLEPHMPFFGPRDGQYDPAEVSLPANFDAPPTEDQPLKTRLLREAYRHRGHSGLALETEAHWRRMIANYWGLCSLVDTHVGAILDAVEELGLGERTIVVYTSDHGDMMGSHRLIAKCTMFEEAVRVPMLLRLPGQRRPRRIARPVSQIDLVPTLLDLMGCEAPPHLQGRSLRPLLAGRRPPDHDVFVEWNGPDASIIGGGRGDLPLPEGAERPAPDDVAAAVRDPVRTVVTPDGWKLNCSPLGEHELYDLNADPWETTNLAWRGELRGRMGDLAGRIRHWQTRTGDTVELPTL